MTEEEVDAYVQKRGHKEINTQKSHTWMDVYMYNLYGQKSY